MTGLAEKAARIAGILEAGVAALRAAGSASEADTQDRLIAPVFAALGYPAGHTRRHVSDRGNYPDRIVWPAPVGHAEAHDLPARFIVEEKTLDTNFDKPRASRADTPSRQIQRYLRQHRLADDSTIGVLTDGRRWRLYERAADSGGGSVAVRRAEEFDLWPGAAADPRAQPVFSDPEHARRLEEFVLRLGMGWFRAADREAPLFPLGRQFLARARRAIADGRPAGVIGGFGETPVAEFAAPPLPATGPVADAALHDWEPDFVLASGPEYRPDEPRRDLPLDGGGPRVRLAAVPFRWPDGEAGARLYKGDIDLCARALRRDGDPLVLCAWMRSANGGGMRMRLAVHAAGRTAMTSEFDPDLPPASVLAKVDKLASVLRAPPARRAVSALIGAFDILPLQREFYARVEGWLTGRLKEEAGGAHDAALVRHLIRALFAWILKEHGIIPSGLFDRDFVRAALAEDPADGAAPAYRDAVLSPLFHDALDRPEAERPAHPVADIGRLLAAAPFLNGSIFAPHPDDALVRLPDDDYWSDDPAEPGLFDILEAFQWTLDEHSAQTHDLSLDPELLGALFERLIGLVDRSRPRKNRKPQGTYYTPRDVVAVMVADALAARMLRENDPDMAEADLRRLFSPSDADVPDWAPGVRERALGVLRRLTFFDPAVGSGAFLLAVVEALAGACAKLDPKLRGRRARGAVIRAIIRDQLHGCDIQPLASQIAKLRLYLAIEAAEGADTGPLPNLEARIVNMDALGAVPDPDWRPGTGAALADADPEFRRLLAALMANRRAWFDAHDTAAKRELAARDAELRAALAECARALALSPENAAFVAWAPLDLDDRAAVTDPRLVFCRDPWPGFDVVIGNPPYDRLPEAARRAARARGYRWTGAGRIEALFAELAMALASPTHGVVELVLPLGVSFRQDHAAARAGMARMSSRIELRHHDMTPGRVFNTDPTAKAWPNKQRAVLLTAVRGRGGEARTTGLRRWFEKPGRNERTPCLENRRTTALPRLAGGAVDARIAGQWLRVPTAAAGQLAAALAGREATVGSLAGGGAWRLALPLTAYQYVTALPAGAVSPRREQELRFRAEDDFKIALAALNGHVAYGWWLMADDGFDVNAHTVRSMGLPDPWLRAGPERERALALADALAAALPGCVVGKLNAGTQWRNVDFFSGAPEPVAEIDRLQIESLGLPFEPLIDHLRVMRSSSSWRLP